jgi:heme oxygenase
MMQGHPSIGTSLSTALSERLRTATRDLHAEVERTGIMPALLSGRIGRADYAALLRNLHRIYAALETAIDRHATHPCIAPLDLRPLARAEALAADLEVVHGPRWRDEIPLDAAGATYAERLAGLDATDPECLVAHAYVRYLGDLSGGRIVHRVVARSLALPDAAGLRFYQFPAVGDLAAAALRFRHALDRLPLDAAAVDRVVAEAAWAFAQHGELFARLAPHGAPRPTGYLRPT